MGECQYGYDGIYHDITNACKKWVAVQNSSAILDMTLGREKVEMEAEVFR